MQKTSRPAILLLALVMVTGACGGSGGGTDSTSGSGPDATPLPMERQVLTVGTLPDRYLNELPERPDLGKYPLNTSVFDTLARMNEDLQVEPRLAERWEFNEATNTYRYFLRKGVKFHDGAELGAEDVKYTWDLIVKAHPTNYQTLGPDSVKVVDQHTVDVTPTKKNNRLIEQLVHPIWGVNRRGSDPLKPVGTGPYRFVEWVKDDRFVVEAFDGYWDPSQAAKAKRITFKFIADGQTKILALRSGELDLIMDVPLSQAAEVKASPGLEVVNSKTGAYNALNFNILGQAPYDLGKDPVIREAVAAGVDRKAVLQKVWGGNADESTTWIPPAVLGSYASTVKGVVHDQKRAAQVLDQAGWTPGPDGIRVKDGRRLTLVHIIAGPGDSDPRDSVAAAELIQDQLKRIGVETKIETPEAAAASARQRNGEYDLLQALGNQNEANPCFLPDLLYYSKGGPTNKWRSPGGKTDQAIERCRSATNIEDVRMATAEAIHELVDVERVIIPLIGLKRIWAMKENVAGFTPHPSLTNQRWEKVFLASGA